MGDEADYRIEQMQSGRWSSGPANNRRNNMAKMKPKKKAKKKPFTELTLWDVILSFPDLHDPKPFKGKVYYSTDILFDKKHPQYLKLKKAIEEVCTEAFGDDQNEWPEGLPFIKSGEERDDMKGYKGRYFIKASTQSPVPVVDPDGNEFNPRMVKGGMFANVAIRISAWEFDGDEGVSIYLQGVQIDTDKEALNFGGGKSVKAMFKRGDDEEDEGSEEDESDDEEEDAPPARKSKKKPSKQRDDEEDLDEEENFDEDEGEEEEEEDEAPAPRKSSKKKTSRRFRDEEDEE